MTLRRSRAEFLADCPGEEGFAMFQYVEEQYGPLRVVFEHDFGDGMKTDIGCFERGVVVSTLTIDVLGKVTVASHGFTKQEFQGLLAVGLSIFQDPRLLTMADQVFTWMLGGVQQ